MILLNETSADIFAGTRIIYIIKSKSVVVRSLTIIESR